MMQLRPYQQELFESIRASIARGDRKPCLVSPTGSGKTALFCYIASKANLANTPVLILVHRRELVEQTSATLTRFDVPHGIIQPGTKPDPTRNVQLGMVQTITRRVDKMRAPKLIIVDECFVAGTLVDGKPIELIKIGDKVRTHNGYGYVTHVFKNKADHIYELKFKSGKILKCTKDHPIFTQRGFISAKELTLHDVMLSITPYEEMCSLRKWCSQQAVWIKRMSLRVFKKDDYEYLQKTWRDNSIQENQWDARSCNKSKSIDKTQGYGVEADCSRGEWEAQTDSPTSTCSRSWLGYGTSCRNRSKKHGISDLLQAAYREFKAKDWRGSRWIFSLLNREKAARQKENGFFRVERLENIEIHKQGSGAGFESVCPDGFVYNLEVSNGNTYFAENILVHNCHHSVSNTYSKIIRAFPDAAVIGFTATPLRLDGKGLKDYFTNLILGPAVEWLMQNGFLCRPKYFAPPMQASMKGIKKRLGDYAMDQAGDVFSSRAVVGDAVSHYRKLCDGSRAVAFCCNIRHAQAVCDQFNEAGIPAGIIHGEMKRDERKKIVEDLASGVIRVMVSVDVISEGFDIPSVETAILLRPTASLGLYLQQIGRILRPSEGKTAFVLDHVGNIARHGFAEDVREWTLDGVEKSTTKKSETSTHRQCEGCYCMYLRSLPTCPECDWQPPAPKIIEQVDGELQEIKAKPISELMATVKSRKDLQKIQKAKGFKPGWVWFKAKELGYTR